jgi:membrane protease YdiL (CAAX protease family)|tara:strand:+ start:733 stop:1383 length:651 start_codon:yes stop_codon:yes gene_type:complete
MVIGMVASIVAAVIVFAVGGYGVDEVMPLSVVAILQAALWTGLLGVPLWLVVVRGVRWVDLGWGATFRDAWQGLGIGIATQVAVVPIIYIPVLLMADDLDVSGPARDLVDKASGGGILLLILAVVVGAPIVEEIFFRGLTLRALEARMRRRTALVVSAFVFGVVHLQFLQFPALLVIGLICGWLAQRDGRIGRAIWAHVGFNAVTVAVLLLETPAG